MTLKSLIGSGTSGMRRFILRKPFSRAFLETKRNSSNLSQVVQLNPYLTSKLLILASAVASLNSLRDDSNDASLCNNLLELNISKVDSTFIDMLEQIVGSENISTDEDEIEAHGTPSNYHSKVERSPDVIVYPHCTEDVSAIVKLCSKYKIPIVPYGGGTSVEGHLLAPNGGVSLAFSRMKNIISLNPVDHDVTVQAGLGYLELNEMLKEHELWFPLDPGPGATLGGMSACRCSGSTAVKYGTMRENVISMTAVLPNGEIIKTGGRAKKSAAGYDLTRLLVGSEGTLAVITEITLKVFKIPAYSIGMRVAFDSVEDAAKAVQEVLAAGIPIGRAEMLDDEMMKIINAANGTNYHEETTVLFELAGESLSSVTDMQGNVESILKKRTPLSIHIATDPKACKEMWRQRKEAFWAGLAHYPDSHYMLTDVCVPISRLAEIIGKIKAEVKDSWLPGPLVAHAGDGNIHCLIFFDNTSIEDIVEAERLGSLMVDWALSMEGTCTGEHGIGYGKIKYLKKEFNPAAINMMISIKKAIDPDNIMNPGKTVPHRVDSRTGKLIACA